MHIPKTLVIILAFISIHLTCLGQDEPVRIIFDTDILEDVEDVNALCLLHAFADEGEAKILACMANGYDINRSQGASIDAVNTFYNRPDIPIGTFKAGWHNLTQAVPFGKSDFTVALRDNYLHDVPDDDQLPDAISVYRKVLSGQPDHSVVIVTTGWLLNIKDLLYSEPDSICSLSGRALVKAKVKELVVMGGKFPEGLEYNFCYRGMGPLTKDVLDHWPDEVPLMFSGAEIGEFIISGKDYKQLLPECPLRLALGTYGETLSEGRMSWDETAVIYGVRGTSFNGLEYWKTHSHGSVFINESDGSNKWLTSPDKNQSYLVKSMPPDSLASLMEKLILKSSFNALKEE